MDSVKKCVPNVSIITVNVRGLHKKSKKLSLFQWLKDNRIDIIFMQETFLLEKDEKYFVAEWKGIAIHSFSDSNHSRGVSILCREGLDIKVIDKWESGTGRLLIVNFELEGFILTCVNVYAPNKINRRKTFFAFSKSMIQQKCYNFKGLIIAGDMNCCLTPLDKSTQISDSSVDSLKCLVRELGVTDIWRTLNSTTRMYSHHNYASGTSSRLDYIFISNIFCSLVKKSSMQKLPKIPDHKAVFCKIKSQLKRGNGYWKLNVSLIGLAKYQEKVLQCIENTCSNFKDLVSKRVLWDLVKFRIKEMSINFSKTLKSVQNQEIKYLEKQLHRLDDDKAQNKENSAIKEKLQKLYDDLYEQKAIGAQIRSRAKWVEKGERNTRFFLNLEKHHQLNNCILNLKNAKGNLLDNKVDIMSEAMNFYKNLYTSHGVTNTEIQNFMKKIKIKNRLNLDSANMLEGDIEETEVLNVIEQMALNKTPGDDGLPVEFYRTFWPNIKDLIMDAYAEAYCQGELASSQKRALLSLIYKKGDRAQLKNYRPISLSNTDYKILAFVLANRLHKVIDRIISNEQTAYIKKRFIGENIRILLDTIEYFERKNEPVVILFLDFEKAYDSIEWEFIFISLSKFGFQEKFINWVKILYKKPSFSIKINGWMSANFEPHRGIRQGCPVSCLISVIIN